MYDLIVIGDAPAVITATIYEIRKRLDVFVVRNDLDRKTDYHLELPWIEEYQAIREFETVKKKQNGLEFLDVSQHLDQVDTIEKKGDKFANKVDERSHDGRTNVLECDGDFVEKSLISNTNFIEKLVKLDEINRNIINSPKQTNVARIFAAGDVTNTYTEEVLVAIGEGAKAALSAYDYLLPQLLCNGGEFLLSPP